MSMRPLRRAPAAGYFVAKSTWLPLTPTLSRELALASLPLRVTASASGCGGGEGNAFSAARPDSPPSAGEGWGEGEPHSPRVTISEGHADILNQFCRQAGGTLLMWRLRSFSTQGLPCQPQFHAIISSRALARTRRSPLPSPRSSARRASRHGCKTRISAMPASWRGWSKASKAEPASSRCCRRPISSPITAGRNTTSRLRAIRRT